MDVMLAYGKNLHGVYSRAAHYGVKYRFAPHGGNVFGVYIIIAASGINSADSWANSIMSMVENAWGLFGASFGPVVILSLFWRRFNYAGACVGIITGAAVDIFWLLTCTNTIIKNPLIGVTGVYEVLPGFVAGLIAAVVVSLLTKAPSSEVDAIFASATDESIDD